MKMSKLLHTFLKKGKIEAKTTMSSNNLSSRAFRKMDNSSFYMKGRSTTSCEELEDTKEKPQMPESKPPESLEVASLLEALRSEPKVENPDFIYNRAVEILNTLKENGTLDKFILSDEEAATLCAVPLLIEAGLISVRWLIHAKKSLHQSSLCCC